MSRKINDFLENKSNIDILAEEIKEAFIHKANKENIEYSFDIAKGTGKIKTKQPNTLFSFDTENGTFLDEFKKALFDKELENIEENSEEEKQLMEKVREFLLKISEKIIAKYKSEIEETIRKVVLPNSKKEDIPLEEITIISIDVADYSSFTEPSKHLLKLYKENSDVMIETDKIVSYIQEKEEEMGKTVEQIFDEEKLAGNPLFKELKGIEKGRKYLYDITIILFIDYSLSHLPPKPKNLS